MKIETRTIGIISGKGGVGKTTTSINLGMALNYFGKSTTVVDGNITTPNIGVYLGLVNPQVSLHEVLKGKKPAHKAIHYHKSGTRFVIASLALKDMNSVDPRRLSKVVKELDGTCDYIILDSAAGLGKEALAVIEATNEIIVVTNPEIAAVTDALKTIRVAKDMNKNILGVIITKSNIRNPELPFDDIKTMLETEILGVVPEDRAVKNSHVEKEAVVHTHPRSGAAIEYKRLAAKIIGIEYEDKPDEQPTLFGWLMKFMGFKE
jgi:septum site-determining protein MinD